MDRSCHIAILTSGHPPTDDRLFYHFAKSLAKHGHQVFICCSTLAIDTVESGVTIKGFYEPAISKTDKIKNFIHYLDAISPDMIICAEPLPVIAAKKYKATSGKQVNILFDITEWYPSKKQLSGLPFFKMVVSFFKLGFFNLYASSSCNKFIAGEHDKLKPYRLLFPFKPKMIIPYYPSLELFDTPVIEAPVNKVVLGYTGKLTAEKGFFNFLTLADLLSKRNTHLTIQLQIIGWFTSNADKQTFDIFCTTHPQIEINYTERQPLHDFIRSLKTMDICFDLRKLDFENSHSLPIKVFYYAAAAKPVIYTKLKSLQHAVDVPAFGFLVDETDHAAIAALVEKYLATPELYRNHAANGHRLFKARYHWEAVEAQFISFVTS